MGAMQNALFQIQTKAIDGEQPAAVTGTFTCRLLCCSTQAGSVIGKCAPFC